MREGIEGEVGCGAGVFLHGCFVKKFSFFLARCNRANTDLCWLKVIPRASASFWSLLSAGFVGIASNLPVMKNKETHGVSYYFKLIDFFAIESVFQCFAY